MAKKRFKDTGVGKFLLEKIPNVVGAIAGDTPVGSVTVSYKHMTLPKICSLYI